MNIWYIRGWKNGFLVINLSLFLSGKVCSCGPIDSETLHCVIARPVAHILCTYGVKRTLVFRIWNYYWNLLFKFVGYFFVLMNLCEMCHFKRRGMVTVWFRRLSLQLWEHVTPFYVTRFECMMWRHTMYAWGIFIIKFESPKGDW